MSSLRRGLVLVRAVVLAGWTDVRQADEVAAPQPAPHHSASGAPRAPSDGSLAAPMRHGMTVAVLAAVLAVAPVSAQAPERNGSIMAPAPGIRGEARSWPRAMSGQLPSSSAQKGPVGSIPDGGAARIDGAFDARGVLRSMDLSGATGPKRTYEVSLYRAKAGDSAWSVARDFGISTMTVWWANRIDAWERLRVGQLLRILPISGIEHVVRDGDTLDSIARAYHADAGTIAEYNGLNGAVVILGQRIIVPHGRGGRYVALDGMSPSSSIPRLQPGQAGRAPVDNVAVATPLLAPAPSSPTGVKASGGVAWPIDPDSSAGPGGPVTEPYVPAWDWGPFPGETDGGSLPPGVSLPTGPNDGFDSFERMGSVGEGPGVWLPSGRDGGVDSFERMGLVGERHGVWIPTGSNDGFDGFDGFDSLERMSLVGERPGAAPAQAAGEAPREGDQPLRRTKMDRSTAVPPTVIPPDAPVPRGHGARDLDWPVGGPAAGPPQGTILTIDDDRLTLTEADIRRQRSLLWPVYRGGRLTQGFHAEHAGIDIADLRGTPLLAAQSGRVVFAGWRDERAGRAIYLRHGPLLLTGYAHMWRVAVEAGDWVERGQVIGYMGSTGYSTGSHVHFTVTAGPIPNYRPHVRDPLLYLRRP